jgi:hypothetical protein
LFTHLVFLRNLLSSTKDDTSRKRDVNEIDDYRQRLLTTQKFDRDRDKLIQKQRSSKSFSLVVFEFVDVFVIVQNCFQNNLFLNYLID